jgi:hypothetical protein
MRDVTGEQALGSWQLALSQRLIATKPGFGKVLKDQALSASADGSML